MELFDVKKVLVKTPENQYEAIELMNKAQQEVIEALHIMQSTIDNWDDKICLQLNKERMTEFYTKYI